MKKALVVYLIVFLAACGKESDIAATPSPNRLKVVASGVNGSVVLLKGTPLDGLKSLRLMQVVHDGEFEFKDDLLPAAPFAVSIYMDHSQGECKLQNANGFFSPGQAPVILECK